MENIYTIFFYKKKNQNKFDYFFFTQKFSQVCTIAVNSRIERILSDQDIRVLLIDSLIVTLSDMQLSQCDRKFKKKT